MEQSADSVSGEGASYLEIREMTKGFDGTRVLQSFSLTMSRGEFVTLLGPSGCGKTTLLRSIAGLLRPDSGTCRIGGKDVTGLPPHRRNVGFVFQRYALFPHLTVRENVGFGLRARGMPTAQIEAEVDKALALVELGDFGRRSVNALSGGQQQRVSLARAIVTKPDVMLLDEPFSALDKGLRETMQLEMRQLLRRIHATAIFVTHDQEEALMMSDRVVVMNEGRVEQIAVPREIYHAPATPFVLRFVGRSLRVDGRVLSSAGDVMTVETALGTLRAPGKLRSGARVLMAVRPEGVRIGPPSGADNTVQMTVRDVIFLGSRTQVLFQSQSGDSAMAEISDTVACDVAPGSSVALSWRVADTIVFETSP